MTTMKKHYSGPKRNKVLNRDGQRKAGVNRVLRVEGVFRKHNLSPSQGRVLFEGQSVEGIDTNRANDIRTELEQAGYEPPSVQ